MTPSACESCGCTAQRACWHPEENRGCRWAAPGLCEACAPGADEAWIHPDQAQRQARPDEIRVHGEAAIRASDTAAELIAAAGLSPKAAEGLYALATSEWRMRPQTAMVNQIKIMDWLLMGVVIGRRIEQGGGQAIEV